MALFPDEKPYDQWWNERGRHDPETVWWVETFRERDRMLRRAFGPTEPPDAVHPFFWDELSLRVPGGCALCFPPDLSRRDHWLYVTAGLTQPLRASDVGAVHEPSGYGCEFAIAVRVPDPWCLDLLQQLMTYTRIATERVAPGHRLPTAFFAENDGTHFPWIKSVRHDDPVPMSEIRAIILWPYKAAPKSLQTATGTFGILAATLITGDEWEAAKQTSSAHVLLLLERAGISQLAEPNRRSVTSDRRWRSDWEEIRSMSDRQVQEMLLRGQE